MKEFFFVLGRIVRLGSLAATIWLIWHGQWRIISIAIGLHILNFFIVLLADIPFRILWKELGYPEMMTTPGLSLITGGLRLWVVRSLPPLIVFLLLFILVTDSFIIINPSSPWPDRLASLLLGFAASLEPPTRYAASALVRDRTRSEFLLGFIFFGKIAYLALMVIYTIRPLSVIYSVGVFLILLIFTILFFEILASRVLFSSLANKNSGA